MRYSMTEGRRETKHKTREPAEDALRESVGTVASLEREQRKAGQQAAETGADVLQTNVEMFQRAMESTTELMMDMAERSADNYARLLGSATDKARQAGQHSSRKVEAMKTLTGTLGEFSLADLSGEWVNLIQRQARRNVDYWNLFLTFRAPQDFVTAQSELVRDNLDDLLQSWRRIVESSMHVGGSVGRKITESTERLSGAA
jgi:hypothetical protein